jgi:hypothetical protein
LICASFDGVKELRAGIWSWPFRPVIALPNIVSEVVSGLPPKIVSDVLTEVLPKVLSEVLFNARSDALSTAPAPLPKLKAEAPRPLPAERMTEFATSSLEAHLPVCIFE